MTENPYTPPKSVLTKDEHAVSSGLISAWLVVLLLLAVGILFAVGTTRFLLFIASRFSEIRINGYLLLAVGWRIAVVAALLATIAGIIGRKQWGRWLGLLGLTALVLYCVLAPDNTVYANSAERAGGFVGRIIFLPLLIAWLAYAFGFSSKSRRYFARTPVTEIEPHV